MRYLCIDWQGFIQQLVYQVSRGYWFYHYVKYPVAKEDRWRKIDEKLQKKYSTDRSKYVRARRKQKGLANFVFLRWRDHAVILHTMGTIDVPNYDDKFTASSKSNNLPMAET